MFRPYRLKELLLKERSGRSEWQTRVEELEGRCRTLTQQLEQARSSEEQHRTAVRGLEESISHGEALRARQQAEEVRRDFDTTSVHSVGKSRARLFRVIHITLFLVTTEQVKS